MLSGIALAGVLLSGCAAPAARAGGGGPGAGQAAAAPTPTPVPADLAVSPPDQATGVRLDAPVTVQAVGGTLDSVVVRELGNDTPVAGTMDALNKGWKANDALDPSATYTVAATARGAGGDTASARTSFTTLKARRLLTAASPNDGDVVGVGMPMILQFNTAIPADRQADLVNRLHVTATPPVNGAWRWFAPNEVHWRPEVYWPAGAKVHMDATFRGLDGGNNYWGENNWTMDFAVGDKHISYYDAATHMMTVTANDKQLYSWPISAGRPQNPSLSGTLVVRYKQHDVLMDSLTIGIPRTAPDGYYEHVYADTAISTNGFFVHAAPWSVGSQGYANVSHGCINLSPDHAQTFYDFSQPGDIVIGSNTGRMAEAGDGEGDWQIPFASFANSGGQVSQPSSAAGGA
ncbi:MAG: L,D-transpeptidase LdtMt2 [Candidatus Dormibacteria bacterium]